MGPIEILQHKSGNMTFHHCHYDNHCDRHNNQTISEAGTAGVSLGSDLIVYYNGGCSFKVKGEEGEGRLYHFVSLSPSAKVFADCEVVARYEEVEGRPPAVLRRQTGSGRVLLSGVHWEVSWMQVKVSLSCGTARSVLALVVRLSAVIIGD